MQWWQLTLKLAISNKNVCESNNSLIDVIYIMPVVIVSVKRTQTQLDWIINLCKSVLITCSSAPLQSPIESQIMYNVNQIVNLGHPRGAACTTPYNHVPWCMVRRRCSARGTGLKSWVPRAASEPSWIYIATSLGSVSLEAAWWIQSRIMARMLLNSHLLVQQNDLLS